MYMNVVYLIHITNILKLNSFVNQEEKNKHELYNLFNKNESSKKRKYTSLDTQK